mmetsp:Transcript_15922/g.48158  ORF Transcript_15922/g.48158 Transcript_15922/m.48158 type:complete len:86 (+) Transcript_15922:625-882(+)
MLSALRCIPRADGALPYIKKGFRTHCRSVRHLALVKAQFGEEARTPAARSTPYQEPRASRRTSKRRRLAQPRDRDEPRESEEDDY